MRLIQAVLIALALAAAGCGGFNDDFTGATIMQRTVLTGAASTLTLEAGDSLTVPAGTFDSNVVVVFSDVFTGGDGNVIYFPTAGKQPEDLIGSVVINTPIDELFHADLPLTFDLILPGESRRAAAIQAGGTYQVYRFDFDNALWQPWGGTTAVVNAAGTQATVTLPTTGFRGFVGSLAIFDGLLAAAPQQTFIHGTVRGAGSAGVATDVGLYIAVGESRFPVALQNGRVPALNGPDGLPITVANTVGSAADGSFTMNLDGSLVGQVVTLEFGHEDAALGTGIDFDLLAPATPQPDVQSMTVRYGENNVQSQPVH